MTATNDDPKPDIWTATAKCILAEVERARATLDRSIKAATDP